MCRHEKVALRCCRRNVVPFNLFNIRGFANRRVVRLIETGEDSVIDDVVKLVKTGLKHFIPDFDHGQLLLQGLQQFRLSLEERSQSSHGARLDMLAHLIRPDFIRATVSRARTGVLLFGVADVSLVYVQIVPSWDSLPALFAYHARIWTILIFMLEPLSSAEFDHGPAITFNVRGMYALVGYIVLSLDQLPAFSIRTSQSLMFAFFRGMALNTCSCDYLFAIVIRTTYSDLIAHVDNQS